MVERYLLVLVVMMGRKRASGKNMENIASSVFIFLALELLLVEEYVLAAPDGERARERESFLEANSHSMPETEASLPLSLQGKKQFG